ncbi:hypothetical protein KY336_01395 [Candidatus Woesearchaeota archaeon]|nr:hypothetical protein [Candidatus Woesearchaeota archaeon]
MAEEEKKEFRTVRVDPDRRRRFFKYVVRHWKNRRIERSAKYRKDFLKKIDKLRNVEAVREIKDEEKLKPMGTRPLEVIEKKIKKILDYEYEMDQEERFNRQILSRLSENDAQKIELLKKILKKERLDTSKLDILDQKFKVISDLRSSVHKMRQTLQNLQREESKEGRAVQKIGEKIDTVYTEVEKIRKKRKAKKRKVKKAKPKKTVKKTKSVKKTAKKKPVKKTTKKKATKTKKKTAKKKTTKTKKKAKKKTKKKPVRKYRLV